MHPSNVFHAPRFGAYFKKHIVDNYRLYLMSLFVLCVVILVVMVLTLSGGSGVRMTDGNPFYLLLLFFTGLIFAGYSFTQLSDKPRGMDFLLLPASHFEKFLATLLITTVGFMLVYHLVFIISVLLAGVILSLRHTTFDAYDWLHSFRKSFVVALHIWFVAHAVIMLGAIYFKKFNIIKTLAYTFVFVVICGLLNIAFVNILFGKELTSWGSAVPFYSVHLSRYSQDLVLPMGWAYTLNFAWRFLLPPALWVLAYVKLKDEEI